MADDIGGLQVDFTAEASQLRSELERIERQLKAFDRTYGRQQVHITAGFTQPGQRVVDDYRRSIQKKINDGSGLYFQPQLKMPKAQDLKIFSASLSGNLPALTVKVKGIWDGWQKAPPTSLTMTVRGASGGSGGSSGSGRAATPPASGAMRANMAVTAKDLTTKWTQEDLAPFSVRQLQRMLTEERGKTKRLISAEIERRQIAGMAQGRSGARGFAEESALSQRLRPAPPPPPVQPPMPEWRRRALAGQGTSKDLTGGVRGFADEDPYTTQLRRQQRQSMRTANLARLSYQDMTPRRHARMDPNETDEQRIARIDEALYGAPQRRAGPGGVRGFAAPAWLKAKPGGGVDMHSPGIARIMDEVSPTGRPGVHIEPQAPGLRSNVVPFGRPVDLTKRGRPDTLYSVARNEEGKLLGALAMFLDKTGRRVGDVMPYVDPAVRRQGIGTQLYAHAQKAGFDVERASDRNAAGIMGLQTDEGEGLWERRKRLRGEDPEAARRAAREEHERLTGKKQPQITIGRSYNVVPREDAMGGARGFTGGMHGLYGPDPLPAAPHWSASGIRLGNSAAVSRPAADLYDPDSEASWAKGQRVQARDKDNRLLWDEGLHKSRVFRTLKTHQITGPKQAQLGITTVGQVPEEEMYQRLKAVVQRASPEAMAQGTGWYQRAGRLAQSVGGASGLGRHQIGAVTAAFSQNAGWGENIRNVQDFFSAWKAGARTVEEVERHVKNIRGEKGFNTGFGALGLTGRTRMALDLAQTGGQQDIEKRLATSPKITAFYKALMGDPNSFTVDRHMALMMSRHTVAGDQRAHDPFQRAGRRLAGEMGMSAADLQAIAWVTALGHEIGGDDPYQMQRTTPTAQRIAMEPRQRTAAQSRATPRGGAPNIAAFTPATPYGLMQSPGDVIDPVTGAFTQAHMDYMGNQWNREMVPSERAVLQAKQRYNRQQAAQQRMFGRYASGPGVGVAAFSGNSAQRRVQRRAEERASAATSAQAREQQAQSPLSTEEWAELSAGPLAEGNARARRESRRRIERLEARASLTAGVGGEPTGLAGRILGPVPNLANQILGPAQQWVHDTATNRVRPANRTQMEQSAAWQPARPATSGTNLDVPTFIRQAQAMGQAAGQEINKELHQQAAGPGLQQTLHPPGIGGGGRDIVGTPSPSENLMAGGRSVRGTQIAMMAEEARVQIAEARGAGQIRAVGTTMASTIGTVLGGRGRQLVQIAEMTHLASEMKKVGEEGEVAYKRAEDARLAYNKAVADKAPTAEQARLRNEMELFNKEAQKSDDRLNAIKGRFDELGGRTGKLRGALVGMGSAVAGTIAGLAIFSTVQDAISGIGTALDPAIDRLTGFRMTADRLAPTLGQSVRGLHGLSGVAIEASVAQTGLGRTTADAIKPMLEQRAIVEGGNAAFAEQLGLIRAAGFFERNPNAGLTQTTGGMFGTPVGGQQPFLEQLLQTGSPVGGPLESSGLGSIVAGAGAGALAGGALGTIAAPGVGTLIGAGIGAVAGGASGALANLFGGVQGLVDPTKQGTLSERVARGTLSEEDTDRLTEFKRALDSTNDAAERASPQVAAAAKAVTLLGDKPESAQAAVDDTQLLLKDMGASADQLEAARETRFAIVDPRTGKAVRDEEAARGFLNTALRGFTMPDRQAAAAQATQQLSAQLQLTQWQGQQQRGTMIPGQQYLNQLASGRAQVGGARAGGFGLRELPPEIAREAPNFEAGTSALTGLQKQMEATAQTGRSQLITMLQQADKYLSQASGSTSNLTGQFKTLEASVSVNATAMRDLQIENMWAQANLQVHQYDEQLRLANQSLRDAQSFLSGMGDGELGLLQYRERGLQVAAAEAAGFRQQDLGLQSQQLGLQSSQLSLRSRELQLMQSQRQINFQRALAGFVTPGASPEEMAARQAEAKLEADFAQQQQDIGVKGLGVDRQQVDLQAENVALSREALAISKEQFAVQQAMITVNAERAVENISNQIALLTEARSVTLRVAVNNEDIAAYQENIAADMEKIQSLIQDASSARLQVMQTAAQMAAAYGQTLTYWNSVILGNLSKFLNGATSLLSNLGGSSTQDTVSGGGGSPTPIKIMRAAGSISDYGTATNITVGEAGPETVAIIRNPRNLTMAPDAGTSGGSGITVQVNVTGNTISSDRDESELAERIARKVEEVMSRKSSLLGLRGH